MSIVKLSIKFAEKTDVFPLVNASAFKKLISWLIDWKYNRIVKLSPWLEEQVKNPSFEVLQAVDKITTHKDMDAQAHAVLKWVKSNLVYQGDLKTWDIQEYWQTAFETLTRWYLIQDGKPILQGEKVDGAVNCGDCEDGAILMYVLCRLKGIPANRLLILAGVVEGGGHCWLAYRPNQFPLNFAFLDWCYWYNSVVIDKRNLFTINKTSILEYATKDDEYFQVKSNYHTLWVAYNEEYSNNEIAYNFKEVKL